MSMRYLLSITNRKTKDIPFMDAFSMVDPKLHSPNRLEWIGDRIGHIKIRNRQMKEVIERLPMPDRLVITL